MDRSERFVVVCVVVWGEVGGGEGFGGVEGSKGVVELVSDAHASS